MIVENLYAIDVINPLVQEYLETELIQEQIENSELSHLIDREVVGWCATMNTTELTDEELTKAIMEFCRNPESAKSRGSAHVASPENSPESGKETLPDNCRKKSLAPGNE